jgi:hypothetical protein
MNDVCNVEFSEYEGQFKRDYAGAIQGCTCSNCKSIRFSYDRDLAELEVLFMTPE